MTIHTIRSGIVAWWSKGRHRLLALAAVATAFGILFGLAMGHWRSSPGPYMRKLEMHGTWLRRREGLDMSVIFAIDSTFLDL